MRIGIFLFICLVWAQMAHGSFDVEPIVATVLPSGQGASASFTVTNGDDTRTPVQLSIVNRVVDVNGKEKFDDTTNIGDMFQVFPQQVILNPKEKRSIRVTYVGDPKIKKEMSFRIIAEEFPIDVQDTSKKLTKPVGTIHIATKYVGSLYVNPNGTAPELEVETTPEPSKEGTKMVLLVKNKGTAHIFLRRPKITAFEKASGKELDIPFDKIPNLHNSNIAAGQSRRFSLLWPKEIPVGPLKVTVELPKKQ